MLEDDYSQNPFPCIRTPEPCKYAAQEQVEVSDLSVKL